MGLSSDTLIQQTNYESLKSIITEKSFRVSYCEEQFDNGTPEEPEIAYFHVFPMICFSEIPISSLHKHLYRYGDCIIGIDQKWAIKNGFNQVHYCQRASIITKSLFETYRYFNEKIAGQTILQTPIYKEQLKSFTHLEYQVAFTKNYSGEVSSKKYKDASYIFAEEKEWRFVPTNQHHDRPLSLVPDEFKSNKGKFQREIGKNKVPFTLNDINYIVVETNKQKLEIRNILFNEDKNIYVNIFTNSEILQRFLGYKNPSIKEYNLLLENEKLKRKKIKS